MANGIFAWPKPDLKMSNELGSIKPEATPRSPSASRRYKTG